MKNFNNIHKKGFTLIEMLATLSILAIMVVMAGSSFQVSMANNRVYSEASQMITIFTLARSEALRRNDYVSICGSSDGATCNNSLNLNTGSIVFVDSQLSGLSNSSQIIKIFDPWNQNDNGKINGVSKLTYSGDGRASNSNIILVCSPSKPSFSVSLLSTGRIALASNVGDGGC